MFVCSNRIFVTAKYKKQLSCCRISGYNSSAAGHFLTMSLVPPFWAGHRTLKEMVRSPIYIKRVRI